MRAQVKPLLCGFTLLAAGRLLASTATPITISSGYNNDVIADGSGSPSSSTTVGIDGTTGFVFYDATYASSHGSLSGVFVSGTVTGSDLNQFLLLGPTVNNALVIGGIGGASSGTLFFSTPVVANTLEVLATAGYGPTILDYIVNFQGGGTASGTLTIADWEIPGPGISAAIGGMGRVLRANGAYDSSGNSNNLYDYSISTFSSAPVASISFAYDTVSQSSSHQATVFAVSRSPGVPEPSVVSLSALGLIGMLAWRRRK